MAKQKQFEDAVDRRAFEAVHTLLQSSDVDPTTDNNSAIRTAAEAGDTTAVQELLAWRGANGRRVEPTANDNEAMKTAMRHNNVAMLQVFYKWAIDIGNTAVMDQIFAWKGPNGERVNPTMDIDSHNTSSTTTTTTSTAPRPHSDAVNQEEEAFFEAIRQGNLEAVKAGLSNPGIDPTTNDSYAIIVAAQHGSADIVDALLYWTGPNGEKVNPVVANPNNAVDIAIQCRKVDVLNVFVYWASETVNLATLNRLLALRDTNNILMVDPTYSDNYAIKAAAKNGHIEVVKALLAWEANGKRVDPTTDNNFAIGLAASEGNTEVVNALLNWVGPNGERIDPTTDNNFAIGMAAQDGHLSIVNALLSWVGPNGKRVNPTADDNYAIHCATNNGHAPVIKALLDWTGPTGERVDPTDFDNYAIRSAAKKGHIEAVKALLAWEANGKRVDPTAKNNEAINSAMQKNNVAILQVFYKWAIDTGNTAVMDQILAWEGPNGERINPTMDIDSPNTSSTTTTTTTASTAPCPHSDAVNQGDGSDTSTASQLDSEFLDDDNEFYQKMGGDDSDSDAGYTVTAEDMEQMGNLGFVTGSISTAETILAQADVGLNNILTESSSTGATTTEEASFIENDTEAARTPSSSTMPELPSNALPTDPHTGLTPAGTGNITVTNDPPVETNPEFLDDDNEFYQNMGSEDSYLDADYTVTAEEMERMGNLGFVTGSISTAETILAQAGVELNNILTESSLTGATTTEEASFIENDTEAARTPSSSTMPELPSNALPTDPHTGLTPAGTGNITVTNDPPVETNPTNNATPSLSPNQTPNTNTDHPLEMERHDQDPEPTVLPSGQDSRNAFLLFLIENKGKVCGFTIPPLLMYTLLLTENLTNSSIVYNPIKAGLGSDPAAIVLYSAITIALTVLGTIIGHMAVDRGQPSRV